MIFKTKSTMYTMEAGGMVEIDQSQNNNLPVGTLLQWEGYGNNKAVITGRNVSTFDGSVFYDAVNLENSSAARFEAWNLKPIAEKKDGRIAVYILPEVMQPAEVLAVYEKAKAIKELEATKAAAHTAARNAAIEIGRKIAAEKIPADAQALIVAAHDLDQSDSQSDYFAHTTTQIIILATSKHKRDIFSEMRKAAALLPQTAHLGPGKDVFRPRVVFDIQSADKQAHIQVSNGAGYAYNGTTSHWHNELIRDEKGNDVEFTTREEAQKWIDSKGAPEPVTDSGTVCAFRWEISIESIEHREKYSMGAGYYLKDGWKNSTGWKVYKYCKYGETWGDEVYLSLGQVCKL